MARDVDGGAFGSGAGGNFAEKVGDWYARVHAFENCLSVLAVTGQNLVVGPHCGYTTYTDCLLADIKMHETSDFATSVFLCRFLFKAPQESHFIVCFK